MDINGTKPNKQDDAHIVQKSRDFQIKRRSRYTNNRTQYRICATVNHNRTKTRPT